MSNTFPFTKHAIASVGQRPMPAIEIPWTNVIERAATISISNQCSRLHKIGGGGQYGFEVNFGNYIHTQTKYLLAVRTYILKVTDVELPTYGAQAHVPARVHSKLSLINTERRSTRSGMEFSATNRVNDRVAN